MTLRAVNITLKHRKHIHHVGKYNINIDITGFCNTGYYYMSAYWK